MLLSCPYCPSQAKEPSKDRTVIRFGWFVRKCDGLVVQRYRCRGCRRSFSEATQDPCVHQKKRHLNELVVHHLCGLVSQRRSAKILRLNRKTVVRKLLLFSEKAKTRLEEINKSLPPATHVLFDDLITNIHTKLKPVAVTVVVAHPTRRILGFEVSTIPMSGRLAKIALAKYGPRKDERAEKRDALFERLKPFIAETATIKSDQEPHYLADVKRHFPNCSYQQHKSKRATVAGQGEMKQNGHDPIFSINQTLAMLRANINRLIRRTWCTSKRLDRLQAHLTLYAAYHNDKLIKNH